MRGNQPKRITMRTTLIRKLKHRKSYIQEYSQLLKHVDRRFQPYFLLVVLTFEKYSKTKQLAKSSISYVNSRQIMYQILLFIPNLRVTLLYLIEQIEQMPWQIMYMHVFWKETVCPLFLNWEKLKNIVSDFVLVEWLWGTEDA